MLTYTESMNKIWEIEKQIKRLTSTDYISEEQREYLKHLERLLKAYTIEHRKVAKKENEYAIR